MQWERRENVKKVVVNQQGGQEIERRRKHSSPKSGQENHAVRAGRDRRDIASNAVSNRERDKKSIVADWKRDFRRARLHHRRAAVRGHRRRQTSGSKSNNERSVKP